ncbi:MAG: methyl-accepting chemotaxis protein [Alphaproteobacteria bacterium]
MLSNMTVKGKLRLQVLVGFVGFIILAAVALYNFHHTALESRQIKTRHLVEAGYTLLEHFYALEKAGTLTAEQAKAQAQAAIKALRYDGKEYFWINDMHPTMVMHPMKPELDGKDLSASADPTGKKLFVEMVAVVKADGAGFVDYMWAKPGEDAPVAKTSYVKGFAPWGWVLGSGIYLDDVWSAFMAEAMELGAITLAGMAILGLFGMSIAAGVNASIHVLLEAFKGLAAYNLTTRAQVLNNDELGQTSKQFNDMTQNLKFVVQGVAEAAGSINHDVQQLREVAVAMNATSNQQQNGMNQISAAVEESAATVREISQLAGEAARGVESISSSAQAADVAMATLKENSKQIVEVTQVIEGISEQINLLALNAAIEAARAGDAGRGFAVVADEVRKLAGNTSKSTQQIAEVITKLQNDVDMTATALSKITGSVGEISQSVGMISTSLDQQSTATNDIARTVAEFNGSMQTLADEIKNVDDSTNHVTGAIEQLAGMTNKFKL